MKSLSSNLRYILPKIEKAERILLFLDYDGTLTPIVKTPDKAVLPLPTRKALKKLSAKRSILISIVSGRSLRHIKRLIGLTDIYYAGCHGMEIEYAGRVHVVAQAKKSLPLLKRLKKRLSEELAPIEGIEIEDKRLILTLHYRNVKRCLVPKLERVFSKVTKVYLCSRKIKVAKGKKVLEIRPPIDWDKGRYCRYLLNRLKRTKKGLLPIYIGDDETDESAFRLLRKTGVTIFVKGEKRGSEAEYYLNSSGETTEFLRQLSLLCQT